MSALDGLNQRFGSSTLFMGGEGLAEERRLWSMKQQRKTPRYATRWQEISVVKA